MLCAMCGARLSESDRFCISCGAEIPRAEDTGGALPLDGAMTNCPEGAVHGDGAVSESADGAVLSNEMIPATDEAYVDDAAYAAASAAPHTDVPEEDTIVFYAPSVLSPEPDVPDAHAYTSEGSVAVCAPPPPEAAVIVQSTATILQGAPPEGVARPSPTSRKAASHAGRAAALLLSVVFTAIFFASAAASLLLACVQGLLASENLPNLAERLDLRAVLEDVDAAGLILDGLEPEMVYRYGIRERDILSLLTAPAVKAFAVKELTACLEALSQGNVNYTPDIDDILDFVRANESLILSETGYQLSAKDYRLLEEALDDPGVRDRLNVGRALSVAELDAGWLELFLSRVTLIVLLSLSGLMMLLLLIVNRRRVSRVFLLVGIPLMLDGLAFTALGLMLHLFSGRLLQNAGLSAGTLSGLLSPLRSGLTYAGLIVFAAGLLGTGMFLLLRRKKA